MFVHVLKFLHLRHSAGSMCCLALLQELVHVSVFCPILRPDKTCTYINHILNGLILDIELHKSVLIS